MTPKDEYYEEVQFVMNIIKKAKIIDDAKFAIQMISSTNMNVIIMAYNQFKSSDNVTA